MILNQERILHDTVDNEVQNNLKIRTMKLFDSHKNDNGMGQEFVQLGRLPN